MIAFAARLLKRWPGYLGLVFPILILCLSCSDDEHVNGPDRVPGGILVYPDSLALTVGQVDSLRATVLDTRGDTLDYEGVAWFPSRTGIVELDTLHGQQVELAGLAKGSVFVHATCRSFSDSAHVLVEWPDTLGIWRDSGAVGYVGVFQGAGDQLVLQTDLNVLAEGVSSRKATYSVRASGWAGFYVEEGGAGGYETKNILDYQEHGHLVFWVKATEDVEVGIRSDNISAGTEFSKVMISDYRVPPDGEWHRASIPLSDFHTLDPRTDFSRMEVYFIASIVGPKIGHAAAGDFWIDDVVWSKD
jgi:hypothetical protein